MCQMVISLDPTAYVWVWGLVKLQSTLWFETDPFTMLSPDFSISYCLHFRTEVWNLFFHLKV